LSGFAAAAANVDLGTSFKLINVLDPTLAQDAATKNYVDTTFQVMILQSQMYLWVILLVVKLKQYHYQELLQLTILD
jgi:hypothetical protein